MEKSVITNFVALDDKDLVQIEGGCVASGRPFPGTGQARTCTWNLILCVLAGALLP
ncbi:MAG: ComC/BlpC family leader-containing pheromone/bacteriocin [Candidatus Kapaibacteriota bacterium]|jgi:hypothetical protein